MVDASDYEMCSRFEWCAKVQKRTDGTVWNVYAIRNITVDGHHQMEKLHRLILGVTDPKIKIDHEDHDGLNCRRYNLRVATSLQNQQNMLKRCDNTSGFKGVRKSSNGKKWTARITILHTETHLGTYDHPEDAARRYDAAAIEAFGEFACLNFPRSSI